jgi:Family of unknown function (DUF6134)
LITRRAVLLGLVAATSAAPGIPADNRLAFRVSRNAKPVGTHVLTFTRRPDGFDIRTAVDIAVRFGPIPLYRYTLRGLEQWRDNQLVKLEATTDDDGTADFARVTRDADGLLVEGSAGPRYMAPANALPGTHWNLAELNGPWINPQNGKLLRPTVERLGRDVVQLGNGRKVEASQFMVAGDVRMALWYDANGDWTALRAPGKDGSTISYELI